MSIIISMFGMQLYARMVLITLEVRNNLILLGLRVWLGILMKSLSSKL